MDFGYYDLGYVESGSIVEVTLSAAANVCLMTSTEFFRYKTGGSFSYYGGYATKSPTRITVPYSGNWYVTIDLGGYSGRLSYGCRVIKPEPDYSAECNSTWNGMPAKRYPNRKKPDEFEDVLYGGSRGNTKGDGHGHVIIEKATGKIVFHRRPGESTPCVWDKENCPGVNE